MLSFKSADCSSCSFTKHREANGDNAQLESSQLMCGDTTALAILYIQSMFQPYRNATVAADSIIKIILGAHPKLPGLPDEGVVTVY